MQRAGPPPAALAALGASLAAAGIAVEERVAASPEALLAALVEHPPTPCAVVPGGWSSKSVATLLPRL